MSRTFIKVNLPDNNEAYIDPNMVCKVAEIGITQNGTKQKRTIITFDDGSTMSCEESAAQVIGKVSPDSIEVKQPKSQTSKNTGRTQG